MSKVSEADIVIRRTINAFVADNKPFSGDLIAKITGYSLTIVAPLVHDHVVSRVPEYVTVYRRRRTAKVPFFGYRKRSDGE